MITAEHVWTCHLPWAYLKRAGEQEGMCSPMTAAGRPKSEENNTVS